MGRTVGTATQLIQQEEQSWSNFRQALRKEDQDLLDELFRYAKLQLPAISFEARPIVFESVLLAMLVAQQKKITRLEQLLDQKKQLAQHA